MKLMDKRLNFVGVASMYIGVIMGAGFASGRECWQFFGVFGKAGYIGIIITGIGFLIFSWIITFLAISKETIVLGEIISPIKSKFVYGLIDKILAVIYYSMLIAMASAGGSLLNQTFGAPQWVGGAIITLLTLITVLGSFSRISKIFRRFVPVLLCIRVTAIILVLITQSRDAVSDSAINLNIGTSWQKSSLLFLSYNCMGMMTIVGSSAVAAKGSKHALGGGTLGVFLLTLITLLLLKVLLIDPKFSSSLSLPMVGWSSAIDKKFGLLYAVVLMGAIYQTATSTYYGFSITISYEKTKKYVLMTGALIAFAAGLTDFKRVVSILYPAQGYIGCLILLLILLNFIKEILNKFKEINYGLK